MPWKSVLHCVKEIRRFKKKDGGSFHRVRQSECFGLTPGSLRSRVSLTPEPSLNIFNAKHVENSLANRRSISELLPGWSAHVRNCLRPVFAQVAKWIVGFLTEGAILNPACSSRLDKARGTSSVHQLFL